MPLPMLSKQMLNIQFSRTKRAIVHTKVVLIHIPGHGGCNQPKWQVYGSKIADARIPMEGNMIGRRIFCMDSIMTPEHLHALVYGFDEYGKTGAE